MRTVHVSSRNRDHQQTLTVGPHTLTADEPVEAGGGDTGPNPFEYLGSALGACTAITVRMYAQRKLWPLEKIEVAVEGAKTDEAYVMKRHIVLHGPLTNEQRERLIEIANKCPVHKTLTGTIRIDTSLVA